jgi:hypothetical protein
MFGFRRNNLRAFRNHNNITEFHAVVDTVGIIKTAESWAGFLPILPIFRLVFCICYSFLMQIVLFWHLSNK